MRLQLPITGAIIYRWVIFSVLQEVSKFLPQEFSMAFLFLCKICLHLPTSNIATDDHISRGKGGWAFCTLLLLYALLYVPYYQPPLVSAASMITTVKTVMYQQILSGYQLLRSQQTHGQLPVLYAP